MNDIKGICSCDNEIKDVYKPDLEVFEFVSTDEANNPIFRCKKCKEFVWG